jgi:hypothetical protein
MMGQHSRSESLFYYFRIEDQVPENHLLRLIDRHISFDFVREKLKDSYSDTNQPRLRSEIEKRKRYPAGKSPQIKTPSSGRVFQHPQDFSTSTQLSAGIDRELLPSCRQSGSYIA